MRSTPPRRNRTPPAWASRAAVLSAPPSLDRPGARSTGGTTSPTNSHELGLCLSEDKRQTPSQRVTYTCIVVDTFHRNCPSPPTRKPSWRLSSRNFSTAGRPHSLSSPPCVAASSNTPLACHTCLLSLPCSPRSLARKQTQIKTAPFRPPLLSARQPCSSGEC
jgi:hypothetical protein